MRPTFSGSFLSLLLCLTGLPVAQAAVVDEFRCEIEVVRPDGTEYLKTKSLLAAVRKPQAGAFPDVTFTQGQAYLQTRGPTPRGEYRIIADLSYVHSLRASSQSGAAEAAQQTCFQISAEVEGVTVRSSCVVALPIPPVGTPLPVLPPGLPLMGHPVEIVGTTPAFDPQARIRHSVDILPVGRLNVECAHQQTLD